VRSHSAEPPNRGSREQLWACQISLAARLDGVIFSARFRKTLCMTTILRFLQYPPHLPTLSRLNFFFWFHE
jgi:hypothetical protein